MQTSWQYWVPSWLWNGGRMSDPTHICMKAGPSMGWVGYVGWVADPEGGEGGLGPVMVVPGGPAKGFAFWHGFVGHLKKRNKWLKIIRSNYVIFPSPPFPDANIRTPSESLLIATAKLPLRAVDAIFRVDLSRLRTRTPIVSRDVGPLQHTMPACHALG